MNKLILRLIRWYMLKHIQRTEVQRVIAILYSVIARQQFIVKAEIVKVKKGKRRYRICFVETGEHKTKVYIRKWTDRAIQQLN